MSRIRVLVVDDSAFARMMLSRILGGDAAIEVVGTARDGADAIERIAALDPDVVTLDLTMPGVDGIGVLRALGGRARPRVIVVSISSIDTELGAEALMLGAIDLIAKPTALANDRLNEIAGELLAKVKAAAQPRVLDPPEVAPDPLGPPAELVMIGTSTGGPQALTRVVPALTAALRAPVALALHIPIGYTEALAARLDRISPLRVVEAVEGMELVRGTIVLARGGAHLRVVRAANGMLRAQVSPLPLRNYVPSVDELFLSGAAAVGAGALGVVLTGMGQDGLEGARAIAAAGGALLTEAASTCVVYGMPRSVHEAGLGAVVAPLDRIAAEILRRA